MKLVKHSSGRLIAYGFNVFARIQAPRMICWSNIDGTDWEWGKTGCDADYQDMPIDVAPEFIREMADGTVIAYQPGICIEMAPTPGPEVWAIHTLMPGQAADG